jgi:hypothetical protein
MLDLLDQLALPVQPVLRDQLDLLARKDHRGFRALQDHRVQLVHRAQLVLMAIVVIR